MIEFRQLGFSYENVPALVNINAEISPGELVGIIGPSGAGKTTLLRILLGELQPTQGSIRTTTKEPLAVGYVPQIDSGERSFPLTIEEMVLLGSASYSRPQPWFDRTEKKYCQAVLRQLGIAELKEKRLNELSGGQFQRALIARALMSRPNLLVLDEPTSGIDLKTRRQVLDLLEELRQLGYTIVLTTHDLNWVAAHLPRIVCLNKTIIADGSPQQVLTSDAVKRTYGADVEVLIHDGRPVVVDAIEKVSEK